MTQAIYIDQMTQAIYIDQMRYIDTNHSCISQAMQHTLEVIFDGVRGIKPKFLSITVPNNL